MVICLFLELYSGAQPLFLGIFTQAMRVKFERNSFGKKIVYNSQAILEKVM